MDGILSNTFWGALFFTGPPFYQRNFPAILTSPGDDQYLLCNKLDDSVITDGTLRRCHQNQRLLHLPKSAFLENVAAKAKIPMTGLNADLNSIFVAIRKFCLRVTLQKADIKGLFADFRYTSNRLGNTVKDKNARLAAVLKGVEGLKPWRL